MATFLREVIVLGLVVLESMICVSLSSLHKRAVRLSLYSGIAVTAVGGFMASAGVRVTEHYLKVTVARVENAFIRAMLFFVVESRFGLPQAVSRRRTERANVLSQRRLHVSDYKQ